MPTPVGEWGTVLLSSPSVSESSSAKENGRIKKSLIHPNILCLQHLDLAGFSTFFSPGGFMALCAGGSNAGWCGISLRQHLVVMLASCTLSSPMLMAGAGL